MSNTKQKLYFCEHIRKAEQRATDDLNLSAAALMQRAGTSAFNTLIQHFPTIKTVAVFCGGGNNAGDAYILAGLAKEYGLTVFVHQFKNPQELPSPADAAAKEALSSGVISKTLEDAIDSEVELIVDGLLGIGLKGAVRESLACVINQINESGLPVYALDVPSGLEADTGRILGTCIHAQITVTFIAPKFGLYTADGVDVCGKIVCLDLGLQELLADINPAACLLDKRVLSVLKPKPKNSHKHLFGHVLVIGGGLGMPGAAYLAALAALKTGAGMVSIATRPEHVGGGLTLLPEAMIYAVESAKELSPLLQQASVCIIGPGLGDSTWAKTLFSVAIASQLPLVVDASALHLLAKEPKHDDAWVLTPHPGEAASLLTCTAKDVQNDRYQAARAIQRRYGGCVLLKGAGTVINNGAQTPSLCTAGNPGMASAGMGDVLSGIIAGLLAQGLSLLQATNLGVWLHATAADDAMSACGQRGLLASELMPYLCQRVNSRIEAG